MHFAGQLWRNPTPCLSTKTRLRYPTAAPQFWGRHTAQLPNDRTRMAQKITSISPTVSPANRDLQRKLHSPDNGWARHELYLDFNSTEPQVTSYSAEGEVVHVDPPQPPLNPDFLASIRKAVAEGSDIDAVHLHSFNEHLNPEVWQALSGAQPTHLEISPGIDEYCDYAGLGAVNPPWPLKSVYISACEGDGQSHGYGDSNPGASEVSFPACYADIETLVMDYPLSYSMYFYPEGGARNLRSLTVSKNDAISVLVKTIACNPATLHTLRSVTLDSNGGQDTLAVDVDRMSAFFRQSKLERLELLLNDHERHNFTLSTGTNGESMDNVIEEEEQDLVEEDDESVQSDETSQGDPSEPLFRLEGIPQADDPEKRQWEKPYLDLPSNMPSSLISLSFRGPANSLMLQELDKWIAHAEDASWLPALRFVAFRVDLKNNVGTDGELTEEQKGLLKQKVDKFTNTLAARTPPVEVVEPRNPQDLVYPLPMI